MKKTIDIEGVLHWALREELPKGKPVTTDPWDTITSVGRLGTRVDASWREHGLGFISGEPHEDALIVGAELRKLPRDQHIGDDATAKAILGEFYPLDPIAVRNVMATKFNLAAIVLHFAVMGKHPVWDLGTPQPMPVAGDHGQGRGENVKVIGELRGRSVNVFPDKGGRYSFSHASGLRCPLHWIDPTIWEIADSRAEYVAWHAGLCVLASRLAGKLKTFEVLPSPISPAFPWHFAPAIAPQILPAGVAPVDKLPLAPKREAALPPIMSKIEMDLIELAKRRALDRRQAHAGQHVGNRRHSRL